MMVRIDNKKRAFELDFLRGLAIFMMILHHLIYDLRYIMEMDVFAFQESFFFQNILRPPFVFIFLFVSGICCIFSRNNLKRSLKLFAVAFLFAAAFFAFSHLADTEMFIVSNIILVLAVGTAVSYFIQKYTEKKKKLDMSRIFMALTLGIIAVNILLSLIPEIEIPYLAFLHKTFKTSFGMADYMPLIPALSMFFLGAFTGIKFYSDRTTLFPKTNRKVLMILSPFTFIGRYSLWFYILHQPVILAILFSMRWAGIL